MQAEKSLRQGVRFVGGATISHGLQERFERLSPKLQRRIVFYGSLPEVMALALSTSNHRTKSLLTGEGHDGLVHASLRLNPTMEFELLELLVNRGSSIAFNGKMMNGSNHASGRILDGKLAVSYEVRAKNGIYLVDFKFNELLRR